LTFGQNTLEFQSTPSGWRVTVHGNHPEEGSGISIHTLRVEGDEVRPLTDTVKVISIHTLRVEGDN